MAGRFTEHLPQGDGWARSPAPVRRGAAFPCAAAAVPASPFALQVLGAACEV